MAKPRKNDSTPNQVPPVTVLPSSPPIRWSWIIGLTLLALAIRIPFLGRSHLWVDELLFMWDSQLPMTPWQVWLHHYNKFPVAGHLPLGAMFHNLFLHATGLPAETLLQSPLIQRIPAVFWGTISVPVLCLAIRRLANEKLAHMVGFLYAVSFFPVFYSREAYHYAPLMFFSCASLLGFASVYQAEVSSWKKNMAWLVALSAAVLSHISGVMLPLSFVVVGLGALIATYTRGASRLDLKAARAKIGWLIVIPLVSTLPLIPFILVRLARPGQQNVGGAPEWWMILYDLIGKMFAGVTPVAFVFAVIFMLAGLWQVFRNKGGLRYLGFVFVLLTLLIMIGSLKSQYSSRYFTAASPGIYVFFAAGFMQIAVWAGKRSPEAATRIGWGMLIAFALLNIALFHRVAFQLEAKARNYAGMAEWLNNNLQPGGAYILESGYDVRFLGQYHPTPRLTPWIPFFHSTADDVQRLRDTQQAIMLQHPDVPFVEAARHGTEFKPNVPVWTWPHHYYRQRYDLWNRPLQKLVTWGIWPQIHASGMPDIEYHTIIWFNRDEDVEAIYKDQQRKARFDFGSEWEFAQVAQGVYMRVHPPSRAVITVQGLSHSNTTGRLRLVGSIVGREPVGVRIEQDGRILAAGRWTPGQLHEVVVPDFNVGSTTNKIVVISDPQKQDTVQAILLREIELN